MKPAIIICILLPFIAVALLVDAVNTNKGGSIDLRNRITGARIAAADKNPYIYKWNPTEPTVFLDLYNEPGSLLSKTTVTPWVLATQSIFNNLNYRTTQWLWFFIQYGVIILAVYLWMQYEAAKQSKHTLWGIVLALLFCLTPCWRHHVDHGQIYAVYAGLLLIVFWLSHQARRGLAFSLAEGAGNALLLGSRPIFLCQLAEPASKKRWYTLIGTVFGLLFILILPMIIFGQAIWVQYREAMQAHAENYINQRPLIRVQPPQWPITIENIPLDVISRYSRTIPFADTSIYKLISFSLPSTFLLVLWLIVMTGNMIFLIIRKSASQLIWWSAIAWIIIGDFLLPAYRHTYNDVLAIPLLLVGMSAIQSVAPKYLKHWLLTFLAVFSLMILSWKLTAAWFLPLPSVALLLVAVTSVAWSIWIVNMKAKR